MMCIPVEPAVNTRFNPTVSSLFYCLEGCGCYWLNVPFFIQSHSMFLFILHLLLDNGEEFREGTQPGEEGAGNARYSEQQKSDNL